MDIKITSIGDRGQIVIPQSIRQKMHAQRGTSFSVALIDEDTLVIKKIDRTKLLGDFNKLRESIKKKFEEAELVEEVKKSRSI